MSRTLSPERRETHRRDMAERRARQRNTTEYRARWRAKHGLILGLRPSIWANLEFRDCGYRTPCLIWTLGTNDKGYGVTSIGGRQFYVHRLTWEAVNGQMPRKANGKRIVTDHLCRIHACANPDHLEPVTDAINVLRGESFAAANAAKTHCDNEHEFTPENTKYDCEGYRVCVECSREHCRKQDVARRSGKSPTPQGISRLLKNAGFSRSNHGKPGVGYGEVTTGFVCWKTHHADHPEQPYVAVQHDIEGSMFGLSDEDRTERNAEMRARLEDYAKVIHEAGYHALVRDRGDDPPWLTILTVVAEGRDEQ